MNYSSIKPSFLVFCLSLFYVIGVAQDTTNAGNLGMAIQFTNTGIENIEVGNSKEAIKNLTAAISAHNEYEKAYLQLYQAWLIEKTQTQEILILMQQGNRVFEANDELYFYTGELQRNLKDVKGSIVSYTKAINASKARDEGFFLIPYYYQNRGNSYLKTQQLNLALLDYNELLKLNPFSNAGLTNRGITYYQLKNKNAACADWATGIANESKESKMYFDKYCQ